MSRSVEIWQVDGFTARPFGGNPAGVVLDAGGLSDAEMWKIAAEMNVPATAFVAPATRPGHDLKLRWFTPSGKELAFCGHATVATAHLLAETRRLTRDRVIFDTLGGTLSVTVSPTPDGILVWLEPALPTCTAYPETLGPVFEALGVSPEGVGPWAHPALTSERDLLIPAASLGILKSRAPDMARLARLGDDRRIRGFCLTSRETFDRDSLTHSRFFVPHYGIPEDPTTGSVHAAIPVWLWEAGLLKAERGVARFQAEQGDCLGRPGRLQVELHVADGRPARVRVGGRAVTVLRGTLRLE